MNSFKSAIDWLVSAIERASKVLPVSLVIIYVVGFLVVMIQLAQYGVSPLQVFKLNYLVAGGWCLAPVACMYVGAFMGYHHRITTEEERWGRPHLKGMIFSQFLGILAFTIGSVLLTLFFGYMGLSEYTEGLDSLKSDWKSQALVLLILASCLLLSMGITYLKFVPSKSTPDLSKVSKKLARANILSVILTLNFLVYVALFSVKIFPRIPHRLGGGEPLKVSFVLADSNCPCNSFLLREGGGSRTVPYRLLLANDNLIVVVSPVDKEHAIEFDRKLISAIVILKQSFRGSLEELRH